MWARNSPFARQRHPQDTVEVSDMPSIGEAQITSNGRRLGNVRVVSIQSDGAVYPRLHIRTDWSLLNVTKDEFGSAAEFRDYHVRAVTGELRLSEHGHPLGGVYLVGQNRSVSSSDKGFEQGLELAVDLDLHRIEAIERARGTQPPTLYLQLWPSVDGKDGRLDVTVPALRLEVPRDSWLAFRQAVDSQPYEIIEVRFRPEDAPRYNTAVAHVRAARTKTINGDFSGALTDCRKAIEALGIAEHVSKASNPWADAIASVKSERIAEQYAGIIARVKQLAGYAIHELGHPDPNYSRDEIIFILRTTENILALVGSLNVQLPAG
jgi:hypothetical protein